MHLSQILARDVSRRSRALGLNYFNSGAVRSLSTADGYVRASVRGSDDYLVSIEASGVCVRASCTCPYFADRVDICKHIWAAILAAEAQSVPIVSPETRLDEVYLDPLYPDEDHADGFEEPIPAAWQLRPPLAGGSQKRTPAPPPAWRQLLDVVSAGTLPVRESRVLQGQLLYVVDHAATIAAAALVIELMTRDRKVNGEWGKPRPFALSATDAQAHPDPIDRQILQRLFGGQPYTGWIDYGAYGQSLSQVKLTGVILADLLPTICATGRCVLRVLPQEEPLAIPEPPLRWRWSSPRGRSERKDTRHKRPPAVLTPIEWDDGPAWEVHVSIRLAQEPPGYMVEGWLARGDERMALADALIVLGDGILITATRAARLNPAGIAWFAGLRGNERILVPLDGREALIDTLLANPPKLAETPENLRIEVVAPEPRPRLRLKPMTFRADRLHAELAFDYDDTIVPSEAVPNVVRVPGSTRAVRRHPDAERRALEILHQRGVRQDWNDETGTRTLQLHLHMLPGVVRRLLAEGWHVDVAGKAYRRPGATTLAVRSSGIDWFELHGGVAYDDQEVPFPALLAAVARGESFVTLGDGTVGLLPEDWLQRYGRLVRLGTSSGELVRFKRSQVALLDALIAAQPEASWDETFAAARAELMGFEGIKPADAPASFRGTLRGYQREGLGWLLFLQRFGFGGCLADDMGLGKTVMVLALLAARRELYEAEGAAGQTAQLPSLVVAPRSLVFNWRQEAARFTPGLRVLEYVGARRSSLRAAFGEYDVVLTTYGTLRRDVQDLSRTTFDYIVLDEAQAIKNASSVSAKATRVLNARHRLALSGTPIENRLAELWSVFEFLNPGLLGGSAAFDSAGDDIDGETLAALSQGLRPFILRRTKDQVATDLPEKTEQTLYCELEKPQRALYDELRAHYRQSLLGQPNTGSFEPAKLRVLEALLRLRQAACHPGLIDRQRAGEASAKLDVLVPRLVEAVAEGHKTLVFSQFTSLLAILRTRLDEGAITYEYLDGRTRDRQARVERFQDDPACRLFLISLKAGGLGLNLTAAEYVFLLDPWWNPAVESQAMDRAHRIGQSRHVFGYRLIARDTVEERVLELQQVKRKLADAVLTADNSLIRNLRREDLELLLS